MTHDIELEKRMICLCHSCETTPSNLYPKHFYNTRIAKIYSVLKEGGSLNTETDFIKHDIDSTLFYECLMISAFSDLEIPLTANKIIGLYNKRGKIKEAQKLLNEAENIDPESLIDNEDGYNEFMTEHDEIGDGIFETLETPWPKLQEDSRFTEGKAITIFCGDPGVGKTFFTIQLFSHLRLMGTKAIMWCAEDDKKFATRRAFAQYIGESGLCDYEFLKYNWQKAKATYERERDVIDNLMKGFYTSDDTNKDNLIKWCTQKAIDGYKIVGIDPITYFSNDDKSHVADQKIMESLNNLRKKYGTRFFIVTHPRESSGSRISQDGIAGGRAVSRFAQNIIWLTDADENGANRKMYTLKTRNGKRKYGGKTLLEFCKQTARLLEV